MGKPLIGPSCLVRNWIASSPLRHHPAVFRVYSWLYGEVDWDTGQIDITISELAGVFGMTWHGMQKHIRYLRENDYLHVRYTGRASEYTLTVPDGMEGPEEHEDKSQGGQDRDRRIYPIAGRSISKVKQRKARDSSREDSDREEGQMAEEMQEHMDQELIVGEMEKIDAGNINFGLDYRHFGGDQGVAIHVYADLDGKQTELLRFDCFDDAPHYHYGPDGKDERLFLDCTTNGAPIPWAMDKLRSRMVPMLVRAGHADVARELDHDLVQSRLDQVESWASSLSQTKGK